jgi:hypothetical protein
MAGFADRIGSGSSTAKRALTRQIVRAPLRARRGHHHEQLALRTVGHHVRRRRHDDRSNARLHPAPRARRHDQRRQLPTTRAAQGGD